MAAPLNPPKNVIGTHRGLAFLNKGLIVTILPSKCNIDYKPGVEHWWSFGKIRPEKYHCKHRDKSFSDILPTSYGPLYIRLPIRFFTGLYGSNFILILGLCTQYIMHSQKIIIEWTRPLWSQY